MGLVRRAEEIEYVRKEQCRVRGSMLPLLGARYEAWFTSGRGSFHAKGKFPEVEGLLIRQDALPEFYRMLVQVSLRVGDRVSLEMKLTAPRLSCISSLSMWNQDVEMLSLITGIGVADAGRIADSLRREGYVKLVQGGSATRYSLTPKGQWALWEQADGNMQSQLLDNAIQLFSAREAERLAGRL